MVLTEIVHPQTNSNSMRSEKEIREQYEESKIQYDKLRRQLDEARQLGQEPKKYLTDTIQEFNTCIKLFEWILKIKKD